jgi:hypothetical protein
MHALARLIIVLGLLVPVPALANRLALVIGINDYEMIPPLTKAVGDAEAMSARLADLGFDVTTDRAEPEPARTQPGDHNLPALAARR